MASSCMATEITSFFSTGRFDFDDPEEVAKKMGYSAEGFAIDSHTSPTFMNNTSSKGRSIDLGFTGGMDIYFVFDASGSIPQTHFQYSLNLAKALVRKVSTCVTISSSR